MARPKFSEMLSARRIQLGLTTGQASRVLRLKEQVFIAFEEGDWNNIPPQGYASAMLSSYARYLGLNPHDVIMQFQKDFDEYSHTVPSDYNRLQQSSRAKSDSSKFVRGVSSGWTDKDLYGSAGPAGSILRSNDDTSSYKTGEFLNRTPDGYSKKYRSSGERTQDVQQSSDKLATTSYGYVDDNVAPPVTPDIESAEIERRPRPNRRRTSTPLVNNRSRQIPKSRNSRDVSYRGVDSSEFKDDLYMEDAEEFKVASSSTGRIASRNIASTERPKVNRRPSSRRPNKQPKKRGILGLFFGTEKRVMFTIFFLVAIIIILIVVLGISSCNNKSYEAAIKEQVTETKNDAKTDDSDNKSAIKTPEADSAPADSKSEEEETKDLLAQGENDTSIKNGDIKVSVQDGQVSWIEIKNGDTSELAQTVTGPWSQSYTPKGQFVVSAGNPSVVDVTQLNNKIAFDVSVSGLGTATIEYFQ